MRARLAHFPEALQLSVADAGGRPRYVGAGNPGSDFVDREWFKAARARPDVPLQFSQVVVGVEFLVDLVLARPLTDARGRFIGAISAPLDVGNFQQALGSLDLGPRGIVAIRRTDNAELVIRAPPLEAEVNKPVTSLLTALYLKGDSTGSAHFTSPIDGASTGCGPSGGWRSIRSW